MSLAPLEGHSAIRARLAQAIRTGRLPQVLLLSGAAAVGKQRLGLWLAQRLLCEHSAAESIEPCGVCAACHQVLHLSHPDLHWFVPIPRPKSDGERQLDEVAESLELIMAERRTSGCWSAPSGMAGHGIGSSRLLLRRATMAAAQGGWRVFLIGHAERLVAQESSPEAANALLKLLEEPPRQALFIMTTTEPGALLTTIRSRAVPIRLGQLSPAERAAVGQQADSGLDATVRAHAESLLETVPHGAEARAAAALRQGVSQGRGDFTGTLDGMASLLSERAREAATRARWPEASAAAAAIHLVLEARERAQGNVNPQLLLAGLLNDLAALELP